MGLEGVELVVALKAQDISIHPVPAGLIEGKPQNIECRTAES